MRQQENYFLGLDPQSELALMDRHLLAFNLVNADLPADALVTMALHSGPGIHELEGLLQLVQQAQNQSQGMGQYIPVHRSFSLCRCTVSRNLA